APHSGPGGRPRRAVRCHCPGRSAPLERRRPGRADRPAQGQRCRPEAHRPATGRTARGVAGAAPGWRGVDRSEGHPVRRRPVGHRGRPGHRVAVAGGPRVHPPGPPAEPPAGGRRPDPPGVEKNLWRRVRQLRAAHPGTKVEVGAEDEARLGLKPITRRVWALKGCHPRSCGRTKSEWLYVYGFARPATGETFTVILPRVKVERMEEALAAFAAHADPDQKKVLVLAVDNAGWPTAKRLAVPPNVRFTSCRHAPRSCRRSSRSGRWSVRRSPTTRSIAWPTSDGGWCAGAGGWPMTGRPSWGPSGSIGRSTWSHKDSTQDGISWPEAIARRSVFCYPCRGHRPDLNHRRNGSRTGPAGDTDER